MASETEAVGMDRLARIKRAIEHMNARNRFLLLALIMVIACAMVMAVMTIILYRHEINQQRELLQVTARSQARLIEAVARYDAATADTLRATDPSHDAAGATLSQIIDGHEHYDGFGETGEFTLARREGDSIVFVLRHRHDTIEHPAPVPLDSDLAEPMRRALKGQSGTVIALDYRGETVLAAHEPVAVLNLGTVAKIDMSEIRAPFIKSGLAAAAAALIVVIMGTALFFRVGNPIIERLEAYSRDLEREVEERKRAEAEREGLIDKLEAQNAELERFTYTVSHDLKSPLITITGYVGMLREDLAKGDSENIGNDLAGISNAATKMSRLLSELLELSRIGRVINPSEEVSLEELAHEASELVGRRAEQNGVRTEISPNLPAVYGDRIRLLEVLQNLIDNAVKYMGDETRPQVEISVRLDGNEPVFFVRDNGIGIEPVYHERVFGLFDQLDQSADGSGVGLALVKRIVEMHGGRIWVESKGSGHGSTFCFTLAANGHS
jgi:signal transduction histidine kinase